MVWFGGFDLILRLVILLCLAFRCGCPTSCSWRPPVCVDLHVLLTRLTSICAFVIVLPTSWLELCARRLLLRCSTDLTVRVTHSLWNKTGAVSTSHKWSLPLSIGFYLALMALLRLDLSSLDSRVRFSVSHRLGAASIFNNSESLHVISSWSPLTTTWSSSW